MHYRYEFGIYLDDQVIGIVHVIEHTSGGSLKPDAYLPDLYVVPDVCGQGLTKKLINSVYSTPHLHECDRVYWLTHENKNTAQQVYDQKTQFMQYRIECLTP